MRHQCLSSSVRRTQIVLEVTCIVRLELIVVRRTSCMSALPACQLLSPGVPGDLSHVLLSPQCVSTTEACGGQQMFSSPSHIARQEPD